MLPVKKPLNGTPACFPVQRSASPPGLLSSLSSRPGLSLMEKNRISLLCPLSMTTGTLLQPKEEYLRLSQASFPIFDFLSVDIVQGFFWLQKWFPPTHPLTSAQFRWNTLKTKCSSQIWFCHHQLKVSDFKVECGEAEQRSGGERRGWGGRRQKEQRARDTPAEHSPAWCPAEVSI